MDHTVPKKPFTNLTQTSWDIETECIAADGTEITGIPLLTYGENSALGECNLHGQRKEPFIPFYVEKSLW